MGKAGRGRREQDGQADAAAVPLDRLAEDWITLWQTELAGLAADPEWIALTQQGLAIGAGWMRLMAAAATPPAAWSATDAPDAAADGAPGPAAAAAAPGNDGAQGVGGAGDGHGADGGAAAEAEALRQRLAELERRLATLERGPGRSRPDRPGARRRRPSA